MSRAQGEVISAPVTGAVPAEHASDREFLHGGVKGGKGADAWAGTVAAPPEACSYAVDWQLPEAVLARC